MKKFIFLVLLLLGVLSMYGQAKPHFKVSVPADTAVCAGAADTITYTVPVALFSAGQYSFTCRADSLTGATGGTLYLQTAATYSTDDDDWQDMATSYTINGSSTVKIRSEGRIYANYMRIRAIFPSSTQTTRLKMEFVYKGD